MTAKTVKRNKPPVSLSTDIQFYERWHRRDLLKQDQLALQERQLLLQEILATMDGPLLVIGCGSAGEMASVPIGARTVGIDISLVAVQQTRAQSPQHLYVVADAMQLPFSSAHFDTLLCSEVIEHLREPERALANFERVLKRNGRLVLTTPNWISFYGFARALGRLFLRRDFTSSDQLHDDWTTPRHLQGQLDRAGFEPQRWLGFWFFPPFGKGRMRLPDSLALPLLNTFMPLERWLRPRLSKLGHVICVIAVKPKGSDESRN